MEFTQAAARAAILLQRAERCRQAAAKAVTGDTVTRLRRRAEQLESEAAIEMAHAALLRHYAEEQDDAESPRMVEKTKS
jgi:hypothetical protein